MDEPKAERFDLLASRANKEFENVSDFVWKGPRLIEAERQIESEKLDKYFPDDPERRDRRWRTESEKLDHTFPYLIAVGNLFSALSLFEAYLLLLAFELQPYVEVQIQDIRGKGATKLFGFFKAAGITLETLRLHQQVQCAIKIRNCLVHASGVLAWSGEAKGLIEVQRTEAYLSPEDRNRRKQQGSTSEEVYLQSSGFGDRLMVRNGYAHRLCLYLRIYFAQLCQAASLAVRIGS